MGSPDTSTRASAVALGLTALFAGIALGRAFPKSWRHYVREVGTWQRQTKGCTGYLLGIDIGGTSVKLGVLDASGSVLVSNSGAITDRTLEGVCGLIKQLADTSLETSRLSLERDIAGIGVCVPGLIDVEEGTVKFAANFPLWPKPAPLADRVQAMLGLRPRVENDANVALLAEVWQGAASGAANAVMLSLGTGVGSAILCDGRLVRGATGFAGEVGHTIFQRNGLLSASTGVRGVLEEYVSARGIADVSQRAVAELTKSQIHDQTHSPKHTSVLQLVTPLETLTSKHVFDSAALGDPLSRKLVHDATEILGITCLNMVRIFDTEVILLGGGLTQAGDQLLTGVQESFIRNYWTLDTPHCSIKLARHRHNAGMIGAAYLAHPSYKPQ